VPSCLLLCVIQIFTFHYFYCILLFCYTVNNEKYKTKCLHYASHSIPNKVKLKYSYLYHLFYLRHNIRGKKENYVYVRHYFLHELLHKKIYIYIKLDTPTNTINSTLLSCCYHHLYPSDSKIKLYLFPSVLARGKFTVILSEPSISKKKKKSFYNWRARIWLWVEKGYCFLFWKPVFYQFWQEYGLP
jgi:hypothetical protein